MSIRSGKALENFIIEPVMGKMYSTFQRGDPFRWDYGFELTKRQPVSKGLDLLHDIEISRS